MLVTIRLLLLANEKQCFEYFWIQIQWYQVYIPITPAILVIGSWGMSFLVIQRLVEPKLISIKRWVLDPLPLLI